MNTLDFETHAIESPPNYPPEPVGLAARLDNGQKVYLAWGHPEGNNCTKQDAYAFLQQVWEDKSQDLLFHYSKFDLAVAEKAFDLPWPDPLRVHDSLYHLFLNEPLAPTLSLKPSAHRILGIPPDEQTDLRNWLVAHGVVHSANKEWGAHISKAPPHMVGPYAKGDVERTWLLYDHLSEQTQNLGMMEAYRREQRLAPILHRNEQQGIKVNYNLLERDYEAYSKQQRAVEAEIFQAIGKEINLDSGVELADALVSAGLASTDHWPKTPTGKLSTAREVLLSVVPDPVLASLLAYRGALNTCLTTFFSRWLTQARLCNGMVHPSWNSVRTDQGGTRTGRLSCFNPNFQNVPKEYEMQVLPHLLPLPLMRKYIIGDGKPFVSADFHSQEVRVLGHFAEGAIQQIYRDNPSADIHQVASDLIFGASGIRMSRKQVKIIAFSILYGAGIQRIADQLGVDRATAHQMKNAYLNTLTGVRELSAAVEQRGRNNEGVRSWGGRVLHAPPAQMTDGRVWDKSYVLINYLIQGSAADQTKEAVIRYDNNKQHGRFLVTVHDEICITVPKEHLKSEVAILREAMEKQEGWDIPHRAEVSTGQNWHNMKVMK